MVILRSASIGYLMLCNQLPNFSGFRDKHLLFHSFWASGVWEYFWLRVPRVVAIKMLARFLQLSKACLRLEDPNSRWFIYLAVGLQSQFLTVWATVLFKCPRGMETAFPWWEWSKRATNKAHCFLCPSLRSHDFYNISLKGLNRSVLSTERRHY